MMTTLYRTILTASLMFISVSFSSAQDRSTSKKPTDTFDFMMEERTPVSLVQPSGIALESSIDPEHYFVGPSDMIAVNIWMSPSVSFSLTVTPEGTLIIPTIGEVKVADLTLAKVKETIVREARKKYLTAEITATLVKPRPIIVSVIGTVLNPGSMTMSAVDRASKAIDNANKLTRLQSQDDLFPVFKVMSRRNITLKHKDGSQERIDIPKYYATNDNQWNPYLREGDIVIVPVKDPTKNVFAIYGQINTPGAYEFVDGDNILDAVKIGNGLTRLAMADSVIFSRLSQDGTTLSNSIINLDEIIAGHQPNIPLEPGDRIIIKKKLELREDYNVDVRGEVLYPGTYPITQNRTHLSEILRQAGGFTEFAALGSSMVIRQSYQGGDMETERLVSLRGQPSGSDSTGFSLSSELRVRQQEVNVNFEKLFAQHDSTQDIILQTQDQIVVP